jgi:uncharacterized protein YndB with AHSA1/START domain
VPRRRRYRLSSTWLLAAPVERCWDVLADPTMSWPAWWPGVRASDVRPQPDLIASTARVEFRAPSRYALRLDLTVASADPPRRVVLTTAGDLVGSAYVDLEPVEAVGATALTRVVVDWDVETTVRWMNALGPALARPFAASHAAVMRSGERGLTRYLAARP